MQSEPGTAATAATSPQPGLSASTDRWARQALARLLGEIGVRRVGLALPEGGGRRLRFTASDRDPTRDVDWCFIDAFDDVPLTSVVRSGVPVLGALDDLDDRYAGLVEQQRLQGTVALAAVSLPGPTASARPAGGLILFYDHRQDFGPEQREALAGRAAELAAELRGLALSGMPRAAAPTAGRHAAVATVDADPRSVGDARRFLRRQLGQWEIEDDLVDTAVLCLSELVTNAVIHTGATSQVRVDLAGSVLTVAVDDQGAAGAGAAGKRDVVDHLAVHGRGLALVDALTSRWGSEVVDFGTTVWFELEIDRSAC